MKLNNLFQFNCKLSKNFHFECQFFRPIRSLKDGLTIFDLDIGVNRNKAFDHAPEYRAELTILNLLIFEFGIYNINHADGDYKNMPFIA